MSRRTKAIVLSMLLPGLGHFLLGRFLFGVLVAFLYSLCLEWLLLTGLVFSLGLAASYSYACVALLIAIWTGALVWVALLVRVDTDARDRRRQVLLAEGMNLLLRDKLDAAEGKLLELLDLDDVDLEGYLYLGSVYEAKRNPTLARNCYRTALNLDEPGKWRGLLRERIDHLEQAPNSSS